MSSWTRAPGSVGVRLSLGTRVAYGRGPVAPDPHRMGLAQQGAAAQAAQHPADHRRAQVVPLLRQEDPQRPLAHAGVLLAQGQNRRLLRCGPGRAPGPMRAARARLQGGEVVGAEASPPAVDRRDRHRKARDASRTLVRSACSRQRSRYWASGLRGAAWGRRRWNRTGTWRTIGEAATHPGLVHPAPVPLAMLGHEGISCILVSKHHQDTRDDPLTSPLPFSHVSELPQDPGAANSAVAVREPFCVIHCRRPRPPRQEPDMANRLAFASVFGTLAQ